MTCTNPKCSRHAPEQKSAFDAAFWAIFGGAVALNALVYWLTHR